MNIRFDKSAVKLIRAAIYKELFRWGDIVGSSKDERASINYEMDMIRMNQLCEIFEASEKEDKGLELQLSAQDFGYLIESMENSLISLEKNVSALKSLKDRVKQEAVLKYGDQINSFVHYDRGAND